MREAINAAKEGLVARRRTARHGAERVATEKKEKVFQEEAVTSQVRGGISGLVVPAQIGANHHVAGAAKNQAKVAGSGHAPPIGIEVNHRVEGAVRNQARVADSGRAHPIEIEANPLVEGVAKNPVRVADSGHAVPTAMNAGRLEVEKEVSRERVGPVLRNQQERNGTGRNRTVFTARSEPGNRSLPLQMAPRASISTSPTQVSAPEGKRTS